MYILGTQQGQSHNFSKPRFLMHKIGVIMVPVFYISPSYLLISGSYF